MFDQNLIETSYAPVVLKFLDRKSNPKFLQL